MGVLSVLRNIDKIADDAGRDAAVAVVSCNNCIRACGAGGEMHLDRICDELAARGVRVEERILVTNPCSRGYLENYNLGSAVKAMVVLACPGTQAGVKSLHPDVEVVAGVDSLGLMISSKATGRLKLVATFPGYEEQLGAEFKMGDTSVVFDDRVLAMNDEVEVTQ
jgi:hypothetical protein